METIEISVIRSKRKTISISVSEEAVVTVRAPYGVSNREIKEFVDRQSEWINAHLTKMKARQKAAERIPPLSEEEEKLAREKAREVLTDRTDYYADILNVTYGRISIRDQKTRWGSCSREGNLNYNWRLILAPAAVLDYVVVHELCHRKQMNHSSAFWREVERVMPDYRQKEKWLKDNGWMLKAAAHR